MKDDPFKLLAERLDALPNGFPPTDDGVELRLLAKIFTPEEAALTAQLRLTRETPQQIADRIGGDPEVLSKELKGKYKKRSLTIRKGDAIKVLRGQFKGKTGKIDRVNLKTTKVYITGIESTKKDGTKTFYPFGPSNLIITELNLDDKKRVKGLERK